MNKEKILITREIPKHFLEPLHNQFEIIQVQDNQHYDKILQQNLSDISALLCMLSDNINAETISKAHNLKIIANYAVGFNNIDLQQASKQGIIVTNTPDILTDATADLTFSLLLNCARNYQQARNFILNNQWSRWEAKKLLGMELKGKTLGVYGLGRIGQAVARRAEAFGMNIIYHNRSKKNVPYDYVSFETLLETSDVISLHCPLNEQSKLRFSKNEFNKMKTGSIFINTARGEMHNEQDLSQALQDKHLFAAGLDVTNPEPCSPESALLKLDNCYITPHIGSATFAARNGMVKICTENIINVLTGKDPISKVN